MSVPSPEFENENLPLRQALMVDTPLQFTLHWLRPPPVPGLLPVKPGAYRDWWEEDLKTRNHAKFCLPLLMANQAGYYLPSPVEADILVKESGDPEITIIHGSKSDINSHSATGSFTIQPMCVLRTLPGYMSYVKGIPNQRNNPFTVMEAMIESWWTPANFGIVCLPNRPGLIKIKRGDPLAQVIFVHVSGLRAELAISDLSAQALPHRDEWDKKRANYRGHELDYFKGRLPDGTPVCPHFKPQPPKVVTPPPAPSPP